MIFFSQRIQTLNYFFFGGGGEGGLVGDGWSK